MRVADCKKLAEKPKGIFRQAKNARRMSGIFIVRWGRRHRDQREDPPDRHGGLWFPAWCFSSQKDYIAVYAGYDKKCAVFS